MGGERLRGLQQRLPLPEARNRALPPPTIGNGMEISRVRFPLDRPVLATPLAPESLLSLVDFHNGSLKGVPMGPGLRREAMKIGLPVQGLDIPQNGLLLIPEVSPQIRPQPHMN